MRAVYCPDRHDFGFRYVKDDLPREDYEALQQLSKWGSLEQLKANLPAEEFQRRARNHLYPASLVYLALAGLLFRLTLGRLRQLHG